VTAFTFGHTLDPQLANIALRDGGKGGKLKVAGSFATNAWGVFDMHGNAWEWCQDLHDTYVAERGSQPNETSGKKRVLRGGSWRVIAPRCRSANRVSDAPNYSADDVGFRVARAVR
jgi:formylglycine-generating enzyme required for sulfatase activity